MRLLFLFVGANTRLFCIVFKANRPGERGGGGGGVEGRVQFTLVNLCSIFASLFGGIDCSR